MKKSIFEIENRLDIQVEFERIIELMYDDFGVWIEHTYKSLYYYLDNYVFCIWKYRDTFVNLDDYLNHIGINNSVINGYTNISKENFLYFIELLANLYFVIEKEIGLKNIKYANLKVENTIIHNIPIILEKMNYELVKIDDRVIIRKRDADIDSILEVVPENISELLLSYNDIRNNNIDSKKSIIKKIDLYIDGDKKKYKSISADLLNSIDIIINNMGINHFNNNKIFNAFSNEELCKWYDKCFKMIIHLIRMEYVSKISKEVKSLVSIK